MSSKARKLLERARSTTAGWSSTDLVQLYQSYDFEIREGKGHIIATHPDFKELRATISRSSGELANGYIRTAVKLIEKLIGLRGGRDG